jgi:hypothetical protein
MLPARCQYTFQTNLGVGQLTKDEANNAAGKVNQTTEEVDEQVKDLGGELEDERCCLLDEIAGSREEGPNELDKRGEDVGEGLDDGRHFDCW